MKIDGIAAIVTGGASGLGAATVKMLVQHGARVALFDNKLQATNEVTEGQGALAITCDVTDEKNTQAAIAQAREAHGVARILVNCAGIGTPGKAIGRDGPMPLSQFSKVIAVNLLGTFNCTRLVAADMEQLDPMVDGERGVVINTASVAAFDGQIGQVAYSSSKGGIVSMTLPLAREFARYGIRVMTIAPGTFATPMLMGLSEKVTDALASSIPFPSRLGNPEEYASLAAHIIDNVMLNGEVIRLDGALRMAPR